jgi:hypothetical protein
LIALLDGGHRIERSIDRTHTSRVPSAAVARRAVAGEKVTLVRILDPGRAECGAVKFDRPRLAGCNATKQVFHSIAFCRHAVSAQFETSIVWFRPSIPCARLSHRLRGLWIFGSDSMRFRRLPAAWPAHAPAHSIITLRRGK